jgi:hypothetical protein
MQHGQEKPGRYPRTLTEHELLVQSGQGQKATSEAPIHPPEPSERLEHAQAEHMLCAVF